MKEPYMCGSCWNVVIETAEGKCPTCGAKKVAV